MSDERTPPIDPELAALIADSERLDAELEKLSPEERKARILANLGLPADASDADIERAIQWSVLKDFASMSPEEVKEWEDAAAESPLFMAALSNQGGVDTPGLTADEFERALFEMTAGLSAGKPRMMVELLINRTEDVKGRPIFHGVIPSIDATTHQDSAPLFVLSSMLDAEDVEALKARAAAGGTINPPAIFLAECNEVDRALLSQYTQEDFAKLDMRGFMMNPRMIKI